MSIRPFHKGEEIGRGLLTRIVKEAGLTREEFLKLLQETLTHKNIHANISSDIDQNYLFVTKPLYYCA